MSLPLLVIMAALSWAASDFATDLWGEQVGGFVFVVGNGAACGVAAIICAIKESEKESP